MKKFILILGLGLFVGLVTAKDMPHIGLSKTFVDADTLIWTDTAFGGWVAIEEVSKLHFFAKLSPHFPDGNIRDTNFASDSFFINVQLSFDRVNVVKTVELDTLLNDADVLTGNDLIVSDSIYGGWMRAMIIWRDTANILTSGAIIGETYGKTLQLHYSIKK